MGPRTGSRGYLQLGDNFEEARWRQTVVILSEEGWLKTLVKCSEEEVDRAQLSSVTVKEKLFCLVEASVEQLRMGAPSGAMEPQEDNKELLAAGKSLLESEDDLTFASAAEAASKKLKKKKKKDAEDTSSDSADDNGVSSELLQDLRKNWLGDGTFGDKKKSIVDDVPTSHRRSRRFALIEKGRRKESKKEDQEASATQAMLQAALGASDPLHGLLALQIAQGMKEKKIKKSRCRSPSNCSSRTLNSSSKTSSDEALKMKGHSKAVANYRRAGKRKFRAPLKYVRKFARHVEEELGAQDKPFRLVDFNRKIHFGKLQDLKRCHYLVCIILEWLLKEEPRKAALQATLTLQAMHQAALGQNWEIAWLLTHVAEDPFKPRLFGGDEESLQHVTAYLKSMNELAKSTQNLRLKGGGKGDQEDASSSASQTQAKSKGKGGNRAKDKDKDKDKGATES